MDCSGCGRDIPDGFGLCPCCGSEVPPVPPVSPTAFPIPSSGEAAAEDRRMALITAGVVVGVAVLLTALTLILMAVLSRETGESIPGKSIRLTVTVIDQSERTALSKAEFFLNERMEAMGIEGFSLDRRGDDFIIELADPEDLTKVRILALARGDLQFRQVLEILGPDDAGYETAITTDTYAFDEESYQALRNREVVLEKEDDGMVYKIRLGPARMSGDFIYSAAADTEQGTNKWQIDFSLTDAATSRFADLTTELCQETEPLNHLAIVLDYEIKSNPRVNEAITEGKGQITGSFTREEAEDLALVLRLGELPVTFTPPVIEVIGE